MALRRLIVLSGIVLLGGCTLVGIRSGTEERSYVVVEQLSAPDVEVRRYAPALAAETTVAADSEEAGRSAAFRLLFDYISGSNREAARVAMTTPVETSGSGAQRIAMTVPVETRAEPAKVEAASPAEAGRYAMRFFLPASFSAATAPQPTDPRVRIVAVPAETMAVLRFTGSRSDAAVDARKRVLLAAVDGSGLRATGAPVAWFYDPPWTLWFLRRNEVAVAVAPR